MAFAPKPKKLSNSLTPRAKKPPNAALKPRGGGGGASSSPIPSVDRGLVNAPRGSKSFAPGPRDDELARWPIMKGDGPLPVCWLCGVNCGRFGWYMMPTDLTASNGACLNYFTLCASCTPLVAETRLSNAEVIAGSQRSNRTHSAGGGIAHTNAFVAFLREYKVLLELIAVEKSRSRGAGGAVEESYCHDLANLQRLLSAVDAALSTSGLTNREQSLLKVELGNLREQVDITRWFGQQQQQQQQPSAASPVRVDSLLPPVPDLSLGGGAGAGAADTSGYTSIPLAAGAHSQDLNGMVPSPSHTRSPVRQTGGLALGKQQPQPKGRRQPAAARPHIEPIDRSPAASRGTPRGAKPRPHDVSYDDAFDDTTLPTSGPTTPRGGRRSTGRGGNIASRANVYPPIEPPQTRAGAAAARAGRRAQGGSTANATTPQQQRGGGYAGGGDRAPSPRAGSLSPSPPRAGAAPPHRAISQPRSPREEIEATVDAHLTRHLRDEMRKLQQSNCDALQKLAELTAQYRELTAQHERKCASFDVLEEEVRHARDREERLERRCNELANELAILKRHQIQPEAERLIFELRQRLFEAESELLRRPELSREEIRLSQEERLQAVAEARELRRANAQIGERLLQVEEQLLHERQDRLAPGSPSPATMQTPTRTDDTLPVADIPRPAADAAVPSLAASVLAQAAQRQASLSPAHVASPTPPPTAPPSLEPMAALRNSELALAEGWDDKDYSAAASPPQPKVPEPEATDASPVRRAAPSPSFLESRMISPVNFRNRQFLWADASGQTVSFEIDPTMEREAF